MIIYYSCGSIYFFECTKSLLAPLFSFFEFLLLTQYFYILFFLPFLLIIYKLNHLLIIKKFTYLLHYFFFIFLRSANKRGNRFYIRFSFFQKCFSFLFKIRNIFFFFLNNFL